jgi:hypothetical protein
MATLTSLKLVAATKATVKSPEVHRRTKLCTQIEIQKKLAAAQLSGESYAPTRLKTVTNADGERVQVTHSKKVKPWWFNSDGGKVCLVIRYGARQIELAKGKTAIECNDLKSLIAALDTVKAATIAGEIDSQLETASLKLREGFGK